MDLNLLISIAAFLGVSAFVGGLLTLFRTDDDQRLENRLDQFTSARAAGKGDALSPTVLSTPLDAVPGVFDALLTRFGRVRLLFDQADTSLKPVHFVAISGALAVTGLVASVYGGVEIVFAPLIALASATLPFVWLIFKRRQRLKKFAAQLPDALELISRALRAGHSLAAGFNLVNDEMAQPIAREFGRVFEEQNLGIPLEGALNSLTDRVPNLDLKFFATAVILQRQTGGDLAEILDKIGYLIRERFKIWGQVQALTGEGRLSGAVLLGLPPALFLAVYRMNRDYIMMLFTDPMGKQMLVAAIVMQILGALVIRKIINIKV
ncbi:MAG TPA: type II secretion system F family protein [Pirellulales bacterium]|nr:type II secretion system F family protein [Pirellulales bacterium]